MTIPDREVPMTKAGDYGTISDTGALRFERAYGERLGAKTRRQA